MSWFLVFVGFCLLIVLHEAGHFLAAKATGMRVERFFLFMGPKVVSFKRGETEYGIAALPLGGYVKITGMSPEEDVPAEVEGRAYYRQKVWKRIVVIAAGPVVNILLAFAILVGVYLFVAQQPDQTVGEVRPGTAAAQVLRPGDRILAVDGHAFPRADREERLVRFARIVGAHRCAGKQVDGCAAQSPVTLRIERDGATRTVTAQPHYDAEAGRALIGFSYGTEPLEIGLGGAADRAVTGMWSVTTGTFHIFTHLFEEKQRNQVSGVVGISDVGHQAVNEGLEHALLLLALVSLSLGLINLLPILPLDGGHIFWSVLEKLRGEPVSLRVIERATLVGVALVAMLVVLGLSNDIGRITGEGFQVR